MSLTIYLLTVHTQSLEQLQQLGLCHGDVGLENFAVGEKGKIVMIDFGLCLRVPYHDRITNEVVDVVPAVDGNHHYMLRCLICPQGARGTQQYMAPEIFADDLPFDGYAIDLWGAAISLFAMLVGNYPWELAVEGNDFYRPVAMGPRPPPNNDRPVIERLDQCALGRLARNMQCNPENVTPWACDLLARMLRHDPQERLTLAQVMGHPWIRDGTLLAAAQEQLHQELAQRPLEE